MSSFLDWLRLFRINKSPMTVLLVEVFFLIGGGVFLSWYNVWLVLWATLLHCVTFGHNTVMDTARGYDKENPHRKHDPLVSGAIQLDEAHRYINWLLILAAGAGIILILTSPGNNVAALGFMVLFIVAGHAYNDGLDKSSVLAFVPYTLAYSSLCSASYFLNGTDPFKPLFITSLFYIVFTLIFQVGWEICLKDITIEKEPNLLRVLKVKVEKGKFKCSFWARLFGYGVKVGAFVLFLMMFVNIRVSAEMVSALILLVITIVFAVLLIETRDYNYNRDVLFTLIEDFASVLLLPVVIVNAPEIGGLAVVAMVIYTIVWYILFNMLTWSSPYRPKD